MLRSTVERSLETTCEASRRIDDVKALHPEIDWRAMADFRNELRHAFIGVDPVCMGNRSSQFAAAEGVCRAR